MGEAIFNKGLMFKVHGAPASLPVAGPSREPRASPSPSLLQQAREETQNVRSSAFTAGFPMDPIILVHGGAGDIPDSRVAGKLRGSKMAAARAHRLLQAGGSALEAVEAAVVVMEEDESFNAGYGSVLNLRGEVEMEASIMRGSDLAVGAVTLVKDFKHPISVAHRVLTDSPHSLLGAEGAKIFALEKGFKTVPPESLISQNARDALNKFLEHREFGRTEIGAEHEGGVGTVGAVAIDCTGSIAVATSTGGMSGKAVGRIGDTPQIGSGTYADDGIGGVSTTVAGDCTGSIAVATSTGGMSGKAVGRIGDTPQIGSGTYADDAIGGVSTTGHGESILKYCLAHSIVKLMEGGLDASTATKTAVNGMTKRLNNTAGAITLSKSGQVGVHFSSKRMSWAYIRDGKYYYGIEQGEVLSEKFE
ncbi:unnamed protein product [Plutella xylostella]|uniref:(diamondback moth) hypothetical protein n=1 Tax=Plutella xylostella TaxID=51655 RepID=A0A8S4G939_PLUXY|nr:unnamed protein product [Plutella xylostella]